MEWDHRGKAESDKQDGDMKLTQGFCFLWMGALLVFWLAVQAAPAAEKKATDAEPYVAHELLVRIDAGMDETQKADIREAIGGILVQEIKRINLERWRLPSDMDTEEAVSRLTQTPGVLYAEPNYLYAPQMIPDDPEFDRLWYLKNDGQSVNGAGGTPGADISAPEAWDMETGSREVVIAVIDSGVAVDHPDLKDNIWTNIDEIDGNGQDDDANGYTDDVCGWDFVNWDNNPSDYSKDLYGDGHGTHVAGIIAAAGNNGVGISGVMWRAQLMPLQVFDLFEDSPFNATTFNIVSAFFYAVENGAALINCSFGGPSFSRAQYEACEFADQNGVLVVAAAGNDGHDNDDFPTYPANYDLENIVSVAATDALDGLASYSNYGKNSVDVAAPGGNDSPSNIYSTTPPKREVMFSDNFESSAENWLTSGVYEDWSIAFDPDFNSYVVMDSIGRYHENEDAYIRTRQRIQAENFRGLNLKFNIFYRLETGYDYLNVEFSEDDIDYSPIYQITGFSDGRERLVLWSNDADFENFYLRFRLTSDGSRNYEGVLIDNISLTGINWRFVGDEYGYKSGTSMATPVVSGVAGLIWSKNPDLTCGEVKQILLDSVDLIDALDGKVVSGGRINADKAVAAASSFEDEKDGSGGGGGGGCFILALGCE